MDHPLLLAALVLGLVVLGATALRRARRTDTPPGEPSLRVVCVGAGFGGLRLAQALGRAPVEVTLVDRSNYHLFQPLLYQVATSALETEEIAHAVRGVFHKQPNVRFRMAEAVGVDWEARALLTAEGAPIPFDRLVIAAGAETASFGVPGAERFCFGLKHLEEAVALRGHVIRRFERVALDPDEIERGALTFVVVGGGATGVEMSVALRELIDRVFADDFPELDVSAARVLLVEREKAVLRSYTEDLRAYAAREIRERGVELLLGATVDRIEGEAANDGPGRATAAVVDGASIPTQTVVWVAGVKAAGLAGALGLPQTRGGRIEVTRSLVVQGHDGVYAIGDIAAGTGPGAETLPQLAPVAQQQARYVASRIADEARGRRPSLEPFRYRDKGTMATIGRGAAVAQLPGGRRLRGWLAWQAWVWLHLFLLVGFRNRLNVFVNWAWNYVTYDRSARLVVDRERVGGLLARSVEAPPAGSASTSEGHAGAGAAPVP
jgi:NADH dehydrogenase